MVLEAIQIIKIGRGHITCSSSPIADYTILEATEGISKFTYLDSESAEKMGSDAI
jgi:hypothetical protein